MMSELKTKIIDMGGKVWEKSGMSRVYIDCNILNELRDEKSLPPVNFGASSNKIFFDCETGAVMRSYKGKKPSLELSL